MELEFRSEGTQRTKAFCTEMVNLLSQMRLLMKKPERRLRNQFRRRIGFVIAYVVLAAMFAALFFLEWRSGEAKWELMAFVLFCILFAAAHLLSYVRLGKLRNLYLNEQQPTVSRFDETGIEVRQANGKTVRAPWSDVTAVRVCRESICFLPRDLNCALFLFPRRHQPELLEYLRQHHPEIPIASGKEYGKE